MATQTLRIALPETALNLTAQVANVAGVSFATNVDVVEVGQGLYTLTITNSVGKYRISITDDDDSAALLAVLYVTTTNTTATFDAVSERVLLEIAEDAKTAAEAGSGGGGETTGLSAAAMTQLEGVAIRLAPQEQTEQQSLDLVQGCDYAAADGTAITWTLTDTRDLTGATATLTLKKGTTTQAFSGTVTETAADTWSISIDLTAAQTAALAASASDWTYTLTLTLTGGHVRPIRLPGHRARVLAP